MQAIKPIVAVAVFKLDMHRLDDPMLNAALIGLPSLDQNDVITLAARLLELKPMQWHISGHNTQLSIFVGDLNAHHSPLVLLRDSRAKLFPGFSTYFGCDHK